MHINTLNQCIVDFYLCKRKACKQHVVVAKAFHGQRYPMPLSVCGNEMMRGAAAPKGPMTYDSTKGNFLWFEKLLWGAERPDLGSVRSDLG